MMTDQQIFAIANDIEAKIVERDRRILLKAAKLALLEFERIRYQIKADPEVIAVITKAVQIAESTLKNPDANQQTQSIERNPKLEIQNR